jgi:hypothetical protein
VQQRRGDDERQETIAAHASAINSAADRDERRGRGEREREMQL